jgi:hypothetical protein
MVSDAQFNKAVQLVINFPASGPDRPSQDDQVCVSHF